MDFNWVSFDILNFIEDFTAFPYVFSFLCFIEFIGFIEDFIAFPYAFCFASPMWLIPLGRGAENLKISISRPPYKNLCPKRRCAAGVFEPLAAPSLRIRRPLVGLPEFFSRVAGAEAAIFEKSRKSRLAGQALGFYLILIGLY